MKEKEQKTYFDSVFYALIIYYDSRFEAPKEYRGQLLKLLQFQQIQNISGNDISNVQQAQFQLTFNLSAVQTTFIHGLSQLQI